MKLAIATPGVAGNRFDWRPHSRSQRGGASFAFTIAVALFGLVAIGVVEIGAVIHQAMAVQDGLRAGTFHAARNGRPLSPAVSREIKNVVKTGDPSGKSPHLASGWSKSGAKVQIRELSYDLAGSAVPFIRVHVSVPYEFLLRNLIPLPPFYLEMSQEVAFAAD